MPITLATDPELLRAAGRLLKPDAPAELRVMLIDNTLDLETVRVSRPVAEELRGRPGTRVSGAGMPLLSAMAHLPPGHRNG